MTVQDTENALTQALSSYSHRSGFDPMIDAGAFS